MTTMIATMNLEKSNLDVRMCVCVCMCACVCVCVRVCVGAGEKGPGFNAFSLLFTFLDWSHDTERVNEEHQLGNSKTTKRVLKTIFSFLLNILTCPHKESISPCRFAQRVALVKNDAILNEETGKVLR